MALEFLERTTEDVQAALHPARIAGGPIVRFTDRQVEILSGGPQMMKRISYQEATELGELLVQAQSHNTDKWLQDRDENPVRAPELSEEPFEYQPLSNKNCIRLLRILPDSDDGMINLHMEEYDLEQDQPMYTCLSYCWGNPHATGNFFDFNKRFADEYTSDVQYPVACDGRLIFVRANLYEALQQLPDCPGLELKTEGDRERRCTLLHAAAEQGNMDAIKVYIFRGAKLETKDTKGRTAIALAVLAGHLEVVKELLQAGANPEIRDHVGHSSLDHALNTDRHDIVDLLLTFDRSKAERYHRKHKHHGDNTLLWIDAICINQADIAEKSFQVAMMDKIYNRANSVTVWLGRDDGYAKLAIQAIDRLFPVALSGLLETSDVVPFKRQNPQAFTQLGIEPITMQEWGALAVLYLRQSFKRLWCVQEIVLQRSVSMWIGDQSVPFDEFLIVTSALYKLEYRHGLPISMKFRPAYNASVTSEAHSIGEFRSVGPFNHELLRMIMLTITWQCFDPRDHIYAVLGMCRNSKGAELIQVDYTKSVGRVFTEVMRLMLFELQNKRSPCLELVACIRDVALKEEIADLPSWVIPFGQPGISSFWLPKWMAAGKGSETFETALAASGSLDELILQGQKIDVITDMATKRSHGLKRVTMYDFDPTWPGLLLQLPQIYPHTQQPRTEALWRTLCADTPSAYDASQMHTEDAGQIKSVDNMQHWTTWTDHVAPEIYAEQFKATVCATVLAQAERPAQMAHKMRNTLPGVLLQAMMKIQLNDSDGPHHVYAPSDDELTEMRDTSLEGPYFNDEASQKALAQYEELYRTDHTDLRGPGCATPSRSEIAAYIQAPYFRVWLPSLNDSKIDMARTFGIEGRADEEADDVQGMDELPPEFSGFNASFGRYCGGRRLFVTEKDYIGLGPMSMQAGDEIWIVKGSRVPFLMRKVEQELSHNQDQAESDRLSSPVRYRYIGDLYVHGMMKGEAVQSEASWENVVLV